MTFLGGLASLGWAGAVWATPEPGSDDLPVPPPPPVVVSSRALELPTIPSFEIPPADGGVHDVRELRVRGRGLLGEDLTVRGYVTWIYDCAQALAKPGVPANEIQQLIDDSPQLCERPKFYLGVSPHAPAEVALWVVDVPRPANKRERIALSKAQIAARTDVPRLTIGDLVAVTGTFALQSPHGEQNSDGLLVYRKLEHVKPSAHQVPIATPPSKTFIATPPPATTPEPATVTGRPSAVIVPAQTRNRSIDDYESCNRALNAKQLNTAITKCREALRIWKGLHPAWYALGNALAMRNDWQGARDAYDQAVLLRPDSAMYQLYDGIALYQVAVSQVDDTRAMFSTYVLARRALSTAARLAPQLWLASYYLGKTEREFDHARPAVEAFTASIQADPSQADPYIALIEIYRAWDFSDQSLAVARQASAHVTTGKVAGVWYEIGMAYDAKRQDAEAVAAFGKAIAAGDNARAKFQRGQIYFRAGDFVNAKRDLEACLTSTDPSLGLAKQVSRSLLVSIAHKMGESSAHLPMGGQLEKAN